VVDRGELDARRAKGIMGLVLAGAASVVVYVAGPAFVQVML